jgi:translation initiation factor IF-3
MRHWLKIIGFPFDNQRPRIVRYGYNRAETTTVPKPKINTAITAPEVRVLDPEGQNLGVMSRDEALAAAKDKYQLDLIEVSASAKPPVVRIMSFDKYRYLEDKAEKKERQAQKAAGIKQVQISAKAAKNDLEVKLRKLHQFLEEGHPVEIQMRLRGREKGNKDWAKQKLQDFMNMIEPEYKMVSSPKFGGRGMIAQIMKK